MCWLFASMNDSDLQLFKNQHSRRDIISVKYIGAYVENEGYRILIILHIVKVYVRPVYFTSKPTGY